MVPDGVGESLSGARQKVIWNFSPWSADGDIDRAVIVDHYKSCLFDIHDGYGGG